ncbi:MAG: tRNA pseudouridine(55) synthase TruB [Clostridia bacterium]|nr:tRNA pseudouridine(55) synthase TruB [Clostridia bacterium]
MMDGFINVLKPPGMSSGTVVAIVKRVTGEKAGHAGTLDPEACGILPVMVGRATRLFDFMVEKQKTYLAEIAFGSATDTQDAQGTVLQRGESYPDAAAVQDILPRFTGDILQTPPMYSALKVGGESLYKMAIKGKKADIPARPIHVDSIDLLAQTPRHGMLLRVVCGRGTYIRTLCHDIGQALGCPSHMRFLLREQTGAFSLDTAVTVEELKAGCAQSVLLPMDAPLAHLPRFDVPPRLQKLCLNGVRLRANEWPGNALAGTNIRLYMEDRLIGISRVGEDGSLTPRAVLR